MTSPFPGRIRRYLPNGITLRIMLALGFVVALFCVAFFGDDGFNQMTPAEVTTVTTFLQTATAGPVYCPVNDAPLADTARYNQFPITSIFGLGSLTGAAPVTSDVVNEIVANALSHTGGREPAYVLVTPAMRAYTQAYGLASPASYTTLLTALAHSPQWKLVVDHAGTVIYEMPTVKASPAKAPARQAPLVRVTEDVARVAAPT
jgi:hypothetical protein